MTCNGKGRLLIATVLVVAWSTSAEACHWRRGGGCGSSSCGYGYSSCGYGYASPQGYYATQQGYVTDGGGYYGGGYPGGYGGYGYGGYGYGGRGYNPGGLGGPWSGLGVRPGLGFGGLGRGR
jgi:hypothetical protein